MQEDKRQEPPIPHAPLEPDKNDVKEVKEKVTETPKKVICVLIIMLLIRRGNGTYSFLLCMH